MTDLDANSTYLPFHAINEFMRPDYRLQIVRKVLTSLDSLTASQRQAIERLTRLFVTVPGFRNSAKAPTPLRLRPTAEAFEKSPHMAGVIVDAWASLNRELSQQLQALLVERGWVLPALEIDRASLPGYLPTWPADEGFAEINQAFHQKYPEAQAYDDDISLMTVWLSGRLPFEGEDEG